MAVSLPQGTAAAQDTSDLHAWAAKFGRFHIDLGTGDGAYAINLARRDPGLGVIGLDTMLDHLRGSRRRHPGNLRFMTADACALPLGMLPGADAVTINFPFGSLLRSLVDGDPGFFERLDVLLGPDGRLEIRVNDSALEANGLDPASAPSSIVRALRGIDGLRVSMRELGQDELRRFPSSWAKRLGFGRPTCAWLVEAMRVAQPSSRREGGHRHVTLTTHPAPCSYYRGTPYTQL